jgi:hypothetical protein
MKARHFLHAWSMSVLSSLLLSSKLWETSGSSSSLPLTMIRFDMDTTIKDILDIHNFGIPFDKFIAKVSAAT